MAQYWSWNDYDIIRKEYPYKGKAIVEDLPERSIANIENKAERLNTYKHNPFTPEEIKIAKAYGKSLHECIIFILPHRTPREIGELLECAAKA